MSDTVKAALIVAVGLALAAFLNGGIYQIVVAGAGSGGSSDQAGENMFRAYRLNRFTGEMQVVLEPPPVMFRVPTMEEWKAIQRLKTTASEPIASPSPAN
jgi:hypothetical protein